MLDLTGPQWLVLQTAAKRDRGNVCPTLKLRGTAQALVLNALLEKGLIIGEGAPFISEFGRVAVKLIEAEWLIRELCGHEGAEGWSEYLRRRLDAYEFVTPETKDDDK
jgi:hypothetical protein